MRQLLAHAHSQLEVFRPCFYHIIIFPFTAGKVTDLCARAWPEAGLWTPSSHFVCCFWGSTNFDEGKNLIIQHKLWIEPVLQVLSGSCLPSLPKNNITFYWIFSCENNSMELASHGQQVSKSVKCVLSHTFQFYNYDIISV